MALEKSSQERPCSLTSGVLNPLNLGGSSSCGGGWCGRIHGPRRSLQGLAGTPLPRCSPPTICLKQAVPRTERALWAEGGSPAPGQKGGPSPQPARPWGGRGRGSWGKGGLCLPDSPVETAGVGRGRQRAPWAGCFPHHGASPFSQHRPPFPSSPELCGWRRGRCKASRS